MSHPHSSEEAQPEHEQAAPVPASKRASRPRSGRAKAGAQAPPSQEVVESEGNLGTEAPAEPRRNSEPNSNRRPPRKRSSRKRSNRTSTNDDARTPGRDAEPRPSDATGDPGESEAHDDAAGYGPDSEEFGDPMAEGDEGAAGGDRHQRKTRKQRYLERKEREREREAALLEAAVPVDTEGIVEISPKGFGFVRERVRSFAQSPKDAFITPEFVREFGLRDGMWVKSISKQGLRGPQLVEMLEINGRPPGECANLPYFEELTAINPDKKLTLETATSRATTRVIDLVAPIGRGQRGLIVAPPRTGKTTLLHHIAEGIQQNYDEEVHLMVVLIDERPEEVTDFMRSFPDVEVYSSSNDSDPKDHLRIALLAIERAKRLVEAGDHVFILMDSITRLARASNSAMRGGGNRGTASGGLLVGALELPRRIFAAARNTREAGSLTIVATALIQTNSKADEAIFQEFKGTGNMELVLDRQISQNYIYPAVDIHKSGTRREELLLPNHVLEKIYVIRRGLGGYRPLDAMEWLLKCMQRYPTNAQMLMDIKTTALS